MPEFALPAPLLQAIRRHLSAGQPLTLAIDGCSAAGKTMTVQVPEDAGFWVYDASGKVAASSVLGDTGAVTLPEGGMVVFAGEAGARFHLRFAA